MNAVATLLGTAARFGGRGQQGQDQRRDPSQDPDRGHGRLEILLERESLDAAQIKERLGVAFGEQALEIVAEDGRIDFAGLADLIRAAQAQELQQRLRMRFGEAAQGLLAEDGTLERGDLERLLARERGAASEPAGQAGRIDARSALDLLTASSAAERVGSKARGGPPAGMTTPGLAMPAPFIELSV